MKKNYSLAIVICAALALHSCKKGDTGPTGPVGPSGPTYTGAITGHVSIFDQYGGQVLNWPYDVQLTLKGGRAVTADSNGYFVFDNVNTGTYSLTASGNNLATTLVNNLGFVKDTFYQQVRISEKPQFNVTGFKAYHNPGSLFDSLVISMPSDNRPRNVLILVSNKANVNNAPGGYLLSYVKQIPAAGWSGTTSVMQRIAASDLNNADIYFGEQVYFAVYSYVVNDVSAYEDPATGRTVFNAVGTPMIDSATAP